MGRKPLFKHDLTNVQCNFFTSALLGELKHIGESKSEALERILSDYADPNTVEYVKQKLLQKKVKAHHSNTNVVSIVSGGSQQLLSDDTYSLSDLDKKACYTKKELQTLIAKKFLLDDDASLRFMRKGLLDGKFHLVDDKYFISEDY